MTDTELLALPKIGPAEAAKYLQNGTSAQEIRVKAQNGQCPFCIAERMVGRYRYRILVGALIQFKAERIQLERTKPLAGQNAKETI